MKKSKYKIYIIEGIAGSGKNTFHRLLLKKLSHKLVYDYTEEELLLGWKHYWIKNIDALRLNFFENFLDYCEKITQQNDKAVFILNRFHISYQIFSSLSDKRSINRYNKIIKRLKKLSAFVYLPIIDDNSIETRSIHKERVNPVWQIHLQKRLQKYGNNVLKDMYSDEQKRIIKLLKKQGLPYKIIHVKYR